MAYPQSRDRSISPAEVFVVGTIRDPMWPINTCTGDTVRMRVYHVDGQRGSRWVFLFLLNIFTDSQISASTKLLVLLI